MTEAELRLRRIQEHRRHLEAGLVDQFARQRHCILWHDIDQIIGDLKHVEELLRKEIKNGNQDG